MSVIIPIDNHVIPSAIVVICVYNCCYHQFRLGDYQYHVTEEANEVMMSFAAQHRDRVFSLAMEALSQVLKPVRSIL